MIDKDDDARPMEKRGAQRITFKSYFWTTTVSVVSTTVALSQH